MRKRLFPCVFLLAATLLASGCSSLLFYPVSGLPLTPAKAGLEFRDLYLKAADGTRLHAWWLPAKAGQEVKGTVLYLHGNEGTEGAERAVATITTGLAWVKAAEYVVVSGKPSKDDLEACWELGATVAAQLMG